MPSGDSQSEPATVAAQRNVGWLLRAAAEQWPDRMAVAMPDGRGADGKRKYRTITFGELDRLTDRIASGLAGRGVTTGTRLALLVPQSIEFVALVFALFKAGTVQILIDPGMGRKNMIRCLAEAEPEGIIGIPAAQFVSWLLGRRFPKLKHRVTVGRPRFPGSSSLDSIAQSEVSGEAIAAVGDATDAAIIFTTGSTGPPKGVLYTHGTFRGQAQQIRDFYGIRPGEIDLPGFPLFALFNAAMGVSTVIPEMDPTRPADIDPRAFIEIATDWQVTQSFGSPALWNTVGRYCEKQSERQLPTIRRVLSAGAPVPPHVLARVLSTIAPQGEMHTPYGATEALPVASNSAAEVLGETQARSADGAGTCVGHRFPGIAWRVIAIDDGPIDSIERTTSVPTGEIGELMVSGSVVTRRYVTRVDANALHKVRDGQIVWHRMGDVGYLDDQDRFWFCGRKAHRVITADGTLFTIPCEAIANGDEAIYRSALVGVGPVGKRTPVLVLEPWPEQWPGSRAARQALLERVARRLANHRLTTGIRHLLLRRRLPVDIRHNSKIFRERLAPWAEARLGRAFRF